MKRILCLLFALLMIFGFSVCSYAAEIKATEAANELNKLGLFNGVGTDQNGTPVYDLDRAPTRHEAIKMLVCLLGKEKEALDGEWVTPFTDVTDWAKPYVGYAYNAGLTSGTSATTFGGDAMVTATQYLTFVLKALGYELEKDFKWDRAWELTDKIGLTSGEYSDESTPFLRGNVAIVSNDALKQTVKGEDKTLLAHIELKAESPKEESKPAETTNEDPKDVAPPKGIEQYSNEIIEEPAYPWPISFIIEGKRYDISKIATPNTKSFYLSIEENGAPVTNIVRATSTNASVCSVELTEFSEVLVTVNGNGSCDIRVFFGDEELQTRTDCPIRIGPPKAEPGISLLRNGSVIKNGNGFGTKLPSLQKLFVVRPLFNGEEIFKYTVDCNDKNCEFIIQGDGSLLIKKPYAGTTKFTITHNGKSGTFSVTSDTTK